MKRHRWIHVREHVYICVNCGAGKVNAQTPGGHWFTTFYLASGRKVVDSKVPPCELGPRTMPALRKYASAIACSEEIREPERDAVMQRIAVAR